MSGPDISDGGSSPPLVETFSVLKYMQPEPVLKNMGHQMLGPGGSYG